MELTIRFIVNAKLIVLFVCLFVCLTTCRIVSIGKGPELSILARSFSKAKWQETNKHEVYNNTNRDMEQNKGKGNDTLENG